MAREQKSKASVSFRLNEKGKISLSGSAGINPVCADLKISLNQIPIGPFQPYFSTGLRSR